jgi:glutamate/tyrosine decarboxylase-like PLP-dependent enzyme
VNARLELDPEETRRLGYAVVDRIADHLAALSEMRVGAKADPADLPQRLASDAPEQAGPWEEVLDTLFDYVLPHTMHVNHPRFFAYVPGPGNFVSAMADAIASALNVFAGTWISGSGPEVIEQITMGWLRGWCGFPDTAGGLFVSGGSAANLTALAVARRVKLEDSLTGAVVYCSDQAHSSLEKGLRILGFLAPQIVKLPSDSEFRLPVDGLAARVASDQASGLRPFCVIATAGTTNTGAIDPLEGLAQFCRGENLWLHVDGAYGAAAVLTSRGRELMRGIEQADSLSFDPHKWLFQPFECGCLLVRDGKRLTETFRIMPEYLKDAQRHANEWNYADQGIQLTRGFRAMKLWMSLKVFGVAAFRAAIERGFELAEFSEQCLRGYPDWDIVTTAQMGIVCFRYRSGSDELHLNVVDELLADGYALATTTALRGRTVLRMCTINPRTKEADISNTIEKIDAITRRLQAVPI